MGAGEKSLPWKILVFVYLSHSLSAWGDRMWSFGVGLFLVIISPESLRVTAVYGLSMGGSILLFGALVGDWVDRTPRLSAARTSLIIQNSSVAICAAIVYVVITFKAQIETVWPDEGLLYMCYALIILVAIVSRLASMATSIAISKDWIVEICGRDKDMLASMSASLRRIDLITKIVSPIATGQIMYFASVGAGALCIGGWNLVSVFVEYYLLWKVYDIVPALKDKKYKCRKDKGTDPTPQEESTIDPVGNHGDDLEIELKDMGQTEPTALGEDEHHSAANKDGVAVGETGKLICKGSEVVKGSSSGKTQNEQEEESMAIGGESQNLAKNKSTQEQEPSCCKCGRQMLSGILILGRGWRTYIKYNVAFAGLGLACLYMTVLGFDNITVGFAYSQGINESIMGILMAGGSVFGILGTILYPIVRRRLGLERTGLFSFFFETLLLCLCVASIWSPGSPFDPLYWKRDSVAPPQCVSMDSVINNVTITPGYVAIPTPVFEDGKNVTIVDPLYNVKNATGVEPAYQESGNLSETGNYTTPACNVDRDWQSYISVGLLMTGIIGARCGLWMADLTITQLFLENIDETERGIVNGVQTSLNQLMDMMKFIMVIVAPQPEVFGILILISFVFICMGWMFYAKYSHNVRGHLFHFDEINKCKCTNSTNNNVTRTIEA